ncbi:MAG TPA: DNA starvation/stationary phase protection protein Dps [Longimicrobiales bacterium]|nr:DNA starvation/stationary phase protection protein Dps [Longimicrobiales bacterium]
MSETTTRPVFETRNDLDAEHRTHLITRLNQLLADSLDLQLQAKVAHWNVRGAHFLPQHQLFDQIHAEALGWTDLIAERIGQLGGLSEGNVQTVAARSRLDVYTQEVVPGEEHVRRVARALSTFAGHARAGVDFAGEERDEVTADILTEVTRGADKLLWFVEAHLQG